MSFKRRCTMWLRSTYLDRWIGALLAILCLVTVLASVQQFAVPLFDWTIFVQHWFPVAAGMAGFYGYSRASHFHPLANLEYGGWLYDQPWDHPQPLPMGPWHFASQDVLFVGLLALVGGVGEAALPIPFDRGAMIYALLVIALFVSGYALTIFIHAAFCFEKYGGLGLPLIYASLLWVWEYPLVVAALLLVAALLAHFSAQRMLLHFPNLFPWRSQPLAVRYTLATSDTGWPYSRLLLEIRNPIVSFEQALSVSIVAGWCAATLAHIPFMVTGTRQLAAMDHEILCSTIETLLWMATVLAVIIRGSKYFRGTRMPISLLGRIATRNWVIPPFDWALGPLVLMPTVGLALPPLGHKLGAPIEATAGGTVFLLMLISLGMGPTIHDWWHSGGQQIVFRQLKKTEHVSTQ